MKEKISKNYYLSLVVGGMVVASYYANSLVVIPELKAKYPGSDIEIFDVSKYGFSFGDAPVIRVDGGIIHHGIRCVNNGKMWRNARECCEEIGVPLKTLYSAIRRRSKVYGLTYEYVKSNY